MYFPSRLRVSRGQQVMLATLATCTLATFSPLYGNELLPSAVGAAVFPTISGQEPANKKPTAESGVIDETVALRKTIKQLNIEVERLRRRVTELERIQGLQAVRDRLTKEEQRAESLQSQLLTLVEKQAGLQARMDQVNEQLRPENIEHLQVGGSLHPEEVRETTRRRLLNEKSRLQSQLDLIQQSHTRLESALKVSDMVIQQLRAQLASRAQSQ